MDFSLNIYRIQLELHFIEIFLIIVMYNFLSSVFIALESKLIYFSYFPNKLLPVKTQVE